MADGTDAPARGGGRLAHIDLLNVMATIAVLFLHFNWVVWEGPDGPAWRSAIAIETLLFWPVPVFFMITGTTLMGYRSRMSTAEFFRRRARRTVVPWLAWSLIGLAFLCRGAAEGHVAMPDLAPLAVANAMAETRIIDFYWFFPALFATYMTLPVLSSVADKDEVFPYLVAIGLLFAGVLPLAHDLLGTPSLSATAPGVALGYPLYAVIGDRLSRWRPTRRQRLGVYALGAAGTAAMLLGTMALSEGGTVSPVLKNQFGPLCVAQSVAVYVLATEPALVGLIGRHAGVAKALRTLSGLSFGVYLMHWFVLRHIQWNFDWDFRSLSFRVAAPLATYALCIAASWACKRVPVLRDLVP